MRKKRIHQDNSQFWSFVLRAGVWGGACFLGGFRGSELAKRALLGPVIERVGGFTLEEAFAHAEEEHQRKAQEEQRLSREIKQTLQPLSPSEIKKVSEHNDKALTLADAFKSELDTLLSTSNIVSIPDLQWLDLIVPPSIILILGGKGSGKTAAAFRFLEIFRYKLDPYVIALPKQCENILPNWVGIKETLEEVPPGSFSLVDEAHLTNNAKDWAKAESREISRLLNLSRQQQKTIAFVTQLGRHLNLDILSSANLIVVKYPSLLQPSFERPELRKIMEEARLAFDSVKGDRKAWSYVYSPDTGFTGLIENGLPSFWSNKLSNMYGYGYQKEKASERLPSSMSKEGKKQRAKELHKAGWSYSKIANYFGVSKTTVFNWIHDYPYK
ncbi:helix-turn-helix domain-containing protein [Chloroflexota bacterium]